MKNPDWNHLLAFHTTASTGSLSAAARRLGLTQPTLSRQVAALEAKLGVMLFERVGRKLVLTPTGRELLEHVRGMDEAAALVTLAASGRVQDVSGGVSISATDGYAAYVLPEVIARIRAEVPQITLVVIATNALSNLHTREADIAVRHVRPDQPGLIGQHLRDTEAHFYASTEWIARNGRPQSPADLAGPSLLGFDDLEQYSQYLRGIGIPISAEDFRLVSASSVVVWEMMKRGLGVAAMLREVAERTPGVERLVPDMPPIPVPVWLVTHRELHTSRRIRLVHDLLAEELSRM